MKRDVDVFREVGEDAGEAGDARWERGCVALEVEDSYRGFGIG